MNTLETVRGIVAKSLGIPKDRVQAGTSAEDLAEWDSLHHFMIVMEIEESFKFKFQLQELGDLNSVDKFVQAVERRVAA